MKPKPRPERPTLLPKQTLTHDSYGNPLPSFILSGRVAYYPMPRKEWKPMFAPPSNMPPMRHIPYIEAP